MRGRRLMGDAWVYILALELHGLNVEGLGFSFFLFFVSTLVCIMCHAVALQNVMSCVCPLVVHICT